MILDDDHPQMKHPAPPSTMSLSPFPPRPTSSSSWAGYHAHPASSSSTSSLPLDAEQPLLPYAFRHPQPQSFDQYPGNPVGVYAGPVGGVLAVLGNGRARFRILVIACGACLLFLLHAHFYRPRHHGPPPHFRPFWGPPPPHPGPGPGGFGDLGPPPGAPDFAQRPPVAVERPEDVAGAQAQTTATLVEPDLPVLPDHLIVQERRPTPPTSPNPWPHLPEAWGGHDWLSPSRFPPDDPYSAGAMKDPPLMSPPPARYLMKAFEWSAREVKATQEKLTGKFKDALGISFDPQTGKAKPVPRDEIVLPKSSSKIKVVNLEQGKGVKKLRKVQWDGKADATGEEIARERREWVKRAFLHVWEGYKEHSWGSDELKPISNTSSNNYNGWGATIIDTLDTLLIMDLSHEYNIAREHVALVDFSYLAPKMKLTTDLPDMSDFEDPVEPPVQAFDEELDNGPQDQRQRRQPRRPPVLLESEQRSPTTIPTFETTIRYLGGLLSAYDLSGDPLMLTRAKELGDWILPSLGTQYGFPILRYTMGTNPRGSKTGRAVLSEVGSLTMEFTRLSMLTGDETYFQAVQRTMDTLDTGFTKMDDFNGKGRKPRLGSLLPAYVDPSHPDSTAGEYTFGGLADSYYEYLIKQFQLMGGASQQYERMYKEAIDSAYEYLIRRVEVVPGRDDLTIIGAKQWGQWSSRLEHLTCFAGGMLGLGAKLLNRRHDMETALNVTEACAWAYESSATGVGPESLTFYEPNDPSRYYTVDSPDGQSKMRKPRGNPMGVRHGDGKYIGRPETIESVFYMYRITGDRKWQDRGWQMFTSWVEHAINESGFSTISNVFYVTNRREDSMESFVLAETLKYYYLLFSPMDFISLDDYVFNTEAHPFRVPKSTFTKSTSKYLWKGPDDEALSAPSFDSNIGLGTPVQLWARVQQAAALNRGLQEKVKLGLEKPVPKKQQGFIRPSEEELENARKKTPAQVREDEERALAKAKAAVAAGLGRGMARPPP
ncbi:seven-hairpin glycosidase [Meredithblackwellia eburnea MCA 4105]